MWLTRNRRADIAGVILIMIVIALIAVPVSAVDGAREVLGKWIVSLLGENGLFQYWVDLLTQSKGIFEQNKTIDVIISQSGLLMGQGLFSMVLATFMETLVIAVCIRVANAVLKNFMNGKVLPTAIGVLAGFLLCGMGGVVGRKLGTSLAYLGLLILGVIAAISMIAIGKLAPPNAGIVRQALLVLLDALVAAMVALYTTTLYLVLQRVLMPAIPWVIGMLAVSIVIMLCTFFASKLLGE